MSVDPYRVLGISPDASLSEVRKAHRKLVNIHHPDHGGTVADFQRVQEAYHSILSGSATDAEGVPGPLGPYLSPDRVFWDEAPHESVVLTLAIEQGLEDVDEFGPDRLSGDFWHIPETSIETIMADDELLRMTVVPSHPSLPPRGTERGYEDEITFHVNDERVSLKLIMLVDVAEPIRSKSFSEPSTAGAGRYCAAGGRGTKVTGSVSTLAERSWWESASEALGPYTWIASVLLFLLGPLLAWIVIGTPDHGKSIIEAISGVHGGSPHEHTCQHINFLDVALILLGLVVTLATVVAALVAVVALPVGLVVATALAAIALLTPSSARSAPLGGAILAAMIAIGSVLVTCLGLRLFYLLIYAPIHC